MKKIRVNLGDRSYEIVIGKNAVKKLAEYLKKLNLGNNAFIITNPVIKSLYGAKLENILDKSKIKIFYEIIPDTEKSKSQIQFLKSINRLAKIDKGGNFFIIALGGGVVGDLAGYIAAAYRRGISYIQVPTTLLAQVDSAIGGKTGIDLSVGKNLVGTFYQPRLVICDIGFLGSLNQRQIRSGVSEIIKYGVIADKKLFEFLEKNYEQVLRLENRTLEKIIAQACQIKAKIVKQDEFEKRKKRFVLNFGHTIGHAIEAASRYSKKVNHGEAVAVGMICSAEIALKMGIIKMKDAIRIENLIFKFGLPTKIRHLNPAKVWEAHWHDKKFYFGKNRFVLPKAIAKVEIFEDIPLKFVKEAIIKRVSNS